MRSVSFGEATISVFNVGDFAWNLSEKLAVPENEWRPRYSLWFEHSVRFPTQCIHIKLPAASILVDPGHHDVVPASSSMLPPEQPPGLITQLQKVGVHPEEITHIVITHAHFDHYACTTVARNGHDVPLFPNARCFLGQAEWNRPDIQEALQESGSNERRTLGSLNQQGLLVLVEGDLDLLPGVRIIAAPGETAGHQIVRVCSEGQTLYCLGDLYHHWVEIERPAWMVRWIDSDADLRNANLRSRYALREAALAENALLIPAHIPLGRLERTESGVQWKAV